MIIKILEALEKGLFTNTIINSNRNNSKIEEENEHGYENDNETKRENKRENKRETKRENKREKHYPKLTSLETAQRVDIASLTFEGVPGVFLFNYQKHSAIHLYKLKSGKATVRLISKDELPRDLSLAYLEQLEHIVSSPKLSSCIRLELMKRN